ncbi:cation:proton antiporter subunit C [Petroclostridium sp. X23]|uniref:sodium:proton antiporter n=1 Tax=Petroclostridium sp. X23 TaxID=3045146 RepID=UPI0024AD5084|nr:cation:proton antiporter subunit C [Petroclostridium sp. X23]WHH57700.1 cation:proton antiporter subunit C [Petroclostridium sp. X23]
MDWLNGETVSIILFFIGIYGIIARRNIVKTVISIGIMESAIILFFMTINFKEGDMPPIGGSAYGCMADPLPQALMITAIVIGVAVTAVSLTMFITLYHKYGTTNWKKVKSRRREQR